MTIYSISSRNRLYNLHPKPRNHNAYHRRHIINHQSFNLPTKRLRTYSLELQILDPRPRFYTLSSQFLTTLTYLISLPFKKFELRLPVARRENGADDHADELKTGLQLQLVESS